MAFQVVFSAKYVPRFSFGLLVAPNLKNKVGALMPPPPRVTTSFQSPSQIGLKKLDTSEVLDITNFPHFKILRLFDFFVFCCVKGN